MAAASVATRVSISGEAFFFGEGGNFVQRLVIDGQAAFVNQRANP